MIKYVNSEYIILIF